MELSEVMTALNPQLALPVVGVVLFVFLVFAFGVRSSVQPPSFDFTEENDRRNKKSKKTKKPVTNGHVQVDTTDKTVDEQVSKAPPGGRSAANKSPKVDDAQAAKNKVKKTATKQEPPKEQPAEKKDVGAGEWTTQLSRKGKKQQKNKKDDTDSGSEVKVDTPKESEVKVDTPKESEVKVDTPKESEKEIAVTEEVPVSPKEKRNKKKRSEVKAKEVPAVQVEVVNEPQKEEVKPAEVPEVEVAAVPDPIPEPVPEVKETSADVIPSSAECVDVVTPVEDKASEPQIKKSPKKKKKGRPAPEPSISDEKSCQDESSLQLTKEVVEPIVTDSGANQDSQVETPSEEVVEKKAIFNEMGEDDWTEAKPQRKKKKARRDN